MKINTLKNVVEMIETALPKGFSREKIAVWVNEVEGSLQRDIFSLDDEKRVTYLPYEEKKDIEVSLSPADEKIYLFYAKAMAEFSLSEYGDYNNTIELYNNALAEFSRYYVRVTREGAPFSAGITLSAYDIAKKHGFLGTESEWLTSLKGEKGDAPVVGVDYFTIDDKAKIKEYIDGVLGAELDGVIALMEGALV